MSSLTKASIIRCLRGAFVADIASMGTHWIYNPKEMADSVPSLEAPEFKTNPPTPKFYSAAEFPGHYGPGMLSPYGEQMLFVLEYLVDKDGKVEGPDMTNAMVTWADTVYTGRRDHALTTLVENVQQKGLEFPNAGANDNQAHCFIKAILVTCLYAGKSDELVPKVTDAIRVHQNNDVAVAFGVAVARLLEHVLLKGVLPSTLQGIPDVTEPPQQAWDRATGVSDLEALVLTMSHELVADESSAFYDLMARSCILPGSFVIPSYYFQQAADGMDYVTALRNNILVAGDTCSRAILIGAILAAATRDDDDNSPPKEWIDKVDPTTWKRIDAAITKLADIAASSGGSEEL